MNREFEPSPVRRTLFDGELLQVGHVAVHPVSSECGEIEVSGSNVLALTLAGVFASTMGRAGTSSPHRTMRCSSRPASLTD